MTSRLLACASGKTKLPWTGMGKIAGRADLGGEDQEFSFGIKCETI